MNVEMKKGNLGKEPVSFKEREALADDILVRGVYEIIENSRGELRRRMLSEKLRVKFGTDPTSPNIHYGRAVPIMKLRDFQKLGHQIVLIIGDFTGEVGDSSDKESGRPMLTKEQVRHNMTTYVEQVGHILDIRKVELHYNSEWLASMGFDRVSRLADLFSVNEFTSRDIIRRRLDTGQRVSVREFLYPLMQGYDSVAIKADIELGGDDQRFNLLAGRTIQDNFGLKKQMVLMTNLITGTDGRKMSSSWGNTINLRDKPTDMFGKVMSAKDEVMIEYFIHCTRVPLDEIEQIRKNLKKGVVNPRDIKFQLASVMTEQIFGEPAALEAGRHFNTVFQQKDVPDKIEEVEVSGSSNIVMIEAGVVKSKGEARRLLSQKGVKIDGKTVDETFQVPDGALLQKGKRAFLRIKHG